MYVESLSASCVAGLGIAPVELRRSYTHHWCALSMYNFRLSYSLRSRFVCILTGEQVIGAPCMNIIPAMVVGCTIRVYMLQKFVLVVV